MKFTNKQLLIFILFLSYTLKVISQNNIAGYVVDNENKPIEYFDASIVMCQDSSILVGGAFENGYFNLTYPIKANCLLQISCIGYQKTYIPIISGNQNIIQIDTIRMKILELSEVSIVAKRPSYNLKNGKIILNVQFSTLSDAGNSLDVLRKIPSLQIDKDNNITLFGKGTPLIILDNKEIQTIQELEVLQSNDIASIEINRNPSARYNASAKAVIKIITKKKKEEKLNLQIYSKSYFARKYSNISGISINNKIGKFTNYLNYEFTSSQSKEFSTGYENNYQPTYVINNNISSENNSYVMKHNLFLGNQFLINSKNEIKIQYNTSNYDVNQNENTTQKIIKSDESEIIRLINQNSDKDNFQISLSVIYKSNFDSLNSLSVSFDYTQKTNNEITYIFENNISKSTFNNSKLNNKNYFDVYSLNTEYNFLAFTYTSLLGVKLSQIGNNGNTQSFDIESANLNFKNTNIINDQIVAAYLTIHKEYDKFTFDGGLREELTITKVKGDEKAILDSFYFSIFPSISLNYEMSENVAFTLSYAKKIDRPSFYELSPSRVYFDSLSYGQGNPLLKPSLNHNFSFDIEFSNSLSLIFEYNYNTNARITASLNDENNHDIVKYVPVNISQSQSICLNLNYNYQSKKYNLYTSGGIIFPFVDIPYLNTIKKMRTPSWNIQLNNDIIIGKRLTLFYNFSYQSKGIELMTTFNENYNLSGGLRMNFFNKKLLATIEAFDILKSSDMVWNDKFGNIESGEHPDNDSRYIRIMFRYTFNNFKNIFKKQSSSEEELNRI